MLQKINAFYFFILNFLLKKMHHISTKISSSTTAFKITNNSKKCFLSTKSAYISMISEGSCDTEDWRNDAKNLPTQE